MLLAQAQALGLFALLMLRVPQAALRREYRRRLWGLLRVRREPTAVVAYVVRCAMHHHAHTMAADMAEGRIRVYNSG